MLELTPNALGYRVDDSPWRVYVDPVAVPSGSEVSARAVRYGFDESGDVTAVVPYAEAAGWPC